MTARLRPSPAPVSVSTVHLSEDRQRWTLTLSLTPELLDLIDAARDDGPVRTAAGASCQMQVEPNLLPGEPFEIDEIVVVRAPQTSAPQPHPRTEREPS